MEIFWLKRIAESWLERAAQGRQPHAVLLTGPAGTGKRALAAWMARQRLREPAASDVPRYPPDFFEHADLAWISPPDDKSTIGIEQIRDLVANLGLTSYEGAGKVAVIEPANVMTDNAANSLLKTLEEPPGDTLIVLVADRHGRLPATIFSRCQRIELQPPAEADALAWLDRLRPGAAWPDALALAGSAPLAAIEALEQLETHAAMQQELVNVGRGSASPLDVAARWAKLEPAFVLQWLARQVQGAILGVNSASARPGGVVLDDSVLQRMDSRNLFCYLDTINRLRAQPTGSFNVQLALEGLLIDWAEGLANAESPVFVTR